MFVISGDRMEICEIAKEVRNSEETARRLVTILLTLILYGCFMTFKSVFD